MKTKLTPSKAIAKVRSLIKKHFGAYIKPEDGWEGVDLKSAVKTSANDPGQWNPHGYGVIITETGIPSWMGYSYAIDEIWQKLADEANAAGILLEPINGAVIAIGEW